MTWLTILGISSALADTPVATTASHEGNLLSVLPMIVIFAVIFYFFMIRPQSKRARDHKNLMSNISVGDEIVTTGGIVGRVGSLKDNFVVLVTGKNVEMLVQKSAIASVLPKGTLDTLN